MLLTKTDLLPVLDDFDPDNAETCLRQLANPAPVIRLSAKKQQGMQLWFEWLDDAMSQHKQNLQQGKTVIPNTQTEGVRMHARQHSHP
jgi:hydrogenase nickel incorporation protein HypB